MKKHGLHRMYVLHYELTSNRKKGLSPIPHNSVASLNTHDMSPFAACWQGLDIDDWQELGLLDRNGAQKERRTRRDIVNILARFLRRKGWLKDSGEDTFSVLEACFSFLADSRAQIVLVNLEDLWLETKPQNVPSTRKEHPNWQRKARYAFEQFCQMPRVIDTLLNINELRKLSRQK